MKSHLLRISVILAAVLAGHMPSDCAAAGRPDDLRENGLGMRLAPVEGLADVLFSVWETRVRDFRMFVEDTARNGGYDYRAGEEPEILTPGGWTQLGWDYGWDHPGFRQTDDHPVTCVSRADAEAFCRWLTRVEREAGRIGPRQRYRLPSNREWSRAAGIGDGAARKRPSARGSYASGSFPWGDTRSPPPNWGNYASLESSLDTPPDWTFMGGYTDGYPRSSPVGVLGPKHGALCDLGGNVWEWTDERADPLGFFHYTRGGAWSTHNGPWARTLSRDRVWSQSRRSNRGFRVVLDLNPPRLDWASWRDALYDRIVRGSALSSASSVAPASPGPQVPLTEYPEPGHDWSVRQFPILMKWIPPGRFLMGSSRAERLWAQGVEGRTKGNWTRDERDPFPVVIEFGFWLAETPVTVGQWRRFHEETGYLTWAERMGSVWDLDQHDRWGRHVGVSWQRSSYPHVIPRSDEPAVFLNWSDAMAFCEWLTRIEREAGRLPEGYEYRLPSEAEWEYACRGGLEQTRFWWGNSAADGKGRLNTGGYEGPFEDVHWAFSDGYAYLAPVNAYGARGRNGFGLADMLGNVWEICLDGYDPNGPHPTPWFGNTTKRVIRGGSHNNSAGRSRCAARDPIPRDGFRSSGFRIALAREVDSE